MFGFFKKKPEEKCESVLGGEIVNEETAQSAVAEAADGYTPDSDELIDGGQVLTPEVDGYVQLSDEELYFETAGLQSTELTVKLKSLSDFDTDAYLANNEQLPYEFRHYLDTRRAFAKALKNCGEDISDYESYEGGRSSVWTTHFDYDDTEVAIEFTLSRADGNAQYIFTAKIVAE